MTSACFDMLELQTEVIAMARDMTSITGSSSFRSARLAPSMDEPTMPGISDEECMSRLALAIAEHDDHRLGEVAQLIGRLAVPIE
jgi:hypothetical protein